MGGHDNCCVYNCSHRRGRKDNVCSFFVFPKDRRSKLLWISATGRADISLKDITDNFKVCGCHFQSGKPNRKDSNSIDAVPSVDLPKSRKTVKTRRTSNSISSATWAEATESRTRKAIVVGNCVPDVGQEVVFPLVQNSDGVVAVCQRMDEEATDDQKTAEFLNEEHYEAGHNFHFTGSLEIKGGEEKEECPEGFQLELDKEETPLGENVIRPLEQFQEVGIGINIGQELPRWNALKDRLQLETNENLAKFLMDYYCNGGDNILNPVINNTIGMHSSTHCSSNSQSKLCTRMQQEPEQNTSISETVTDTRGEEDLDHRREQDSDYGYSCTPAVSDTSREQDSNHINSFTQAVSDPKGQQEASKSIQIIPTTQTDQHASMKQVGSSGVKDTVKKYLIVWAPKRPNSTQKGDSMPNKEVDLKSPFTVSTRPNVVWSEIPIKTATNKTTIISSVSSNKVLASSLKSTQRGQFLPDQNNTHDIGTFVSQPQLTLKNKITDEPLLKDSEKKSSVTWISILKPKKSNIDTRKEIVDTKKEIVDTKKKIFDTKKMVQKLQGNGPFICDACGMTFSYLALLNLHKIKHKSVSKMMYYCKKCKCSVYEKDREAHERTHKKAYKPEMYICQYCGKDFPTMNKCTLHERTHLGERPFICKVCGKALVRKRNLILHEMTHAGKRPHKCRFCERHFVQKHAAINHEWVHTGEKPFKCRFCGKRFTQSGTRNSHERIHTNVRTFHCQYCRKVFAYERECVKHEAVHKDIKS